MAIGIGAISLLAGFLVQSWLLVSVPYSRGWISSCLVFVNGSRG